MILLTKNALQLRPCCCKAMISTTIVLSCHLEEHFRLQDCTNFLLLHKNKINYAESQSHCFYYYSYECFLSCFINRSFCCTSCSTWEYVQTLKVDSFICKGNSSNPSISGSNYLDDQLPRSFSTLVSWMRLHWPSLLTILSLYRLFETCKTNFGRLRWLQ